MNFEDIIARHIAVHSDDVMDLVGFSERAGGGGKYLILQRLHEFDGQDRALGMDKVHVEISDESRSCYGGISEIVLFGDRIVFSFDERSSVILGVDGWLNIKVDESLLASSGAIDFIARMCEPDGTNIIRK